VGFPPVKNNRMPSVDEQFSPPSAPIGIPLASSRTASGEAATPAPIAPPGPIGRPHLEQPASAAGRSNSPAPPDQVFGSAALGADDEIVQPARRHMSNGWDMPVPVTAPGSSRWSSKPASSIWGSSADSNAQSTWGQSIGSGAVGGVPGSAARQPSFGGIGTPFVSNQPLTSPGQQSVIGGGSSVPGSAPGAFANMGLFSPPNHPHHTQHALHPLQQQSQHTQQHHQ
jgi:hypothetical protein